VRVVDFIISVIIYLLEEGAGSTRYPDNHSQFYIHSLYPVPWKRPRRVPAEIPGWFPIARSFKDFQDTYGPDSPKQFIPCSIEIPSRRS
jgi:hypothetical protein